MSTIGYINVALEFFGGLLSLIFILCLCMSNHTKEKLDRLYIRVLAVNTIVLFCDAAAWLFKGRSGTFCFWAVRTANFCVYVFGYVLLAVFTDYLTGFIASRGAKITRTPLRIMWCFTSLAICLVIVSQFTHMYYFIDNGNIYHRQEWFWVSQMFGVICMLLNSTLLTRYRKWMTGRELGALGAYITMPVIALVIQMFIYGVAVLYLATTLSALCIYISIQVEQSHKLEQEELELEKKRTAIMLSQIQPHFLYNSLSVVKGLCQTDPGQAELAVDHFSDFLRGNMDSLTNPDLIPFEQELLHTQHYLELEQMRFGERVKVVYDTPALQFMVPPLTLQPIVENAVRHGITKCEDGGKVIIATEETPSAYRIIVTDNGAGYNTAKPVKDNARHIGTSNVRKRLQSQCGGELTIQSAVGQGTTAVITIPKEENL